MIQRQECGWIVLSVWNILLICFIIFIALILTGVLPDELLVSCKIPLDFLYNIS
jgi:hypothetical protein